MAVNVLTLAAAVRGIILAFEVGAINSSQRQALQRVKRLLGDNVEECHHENAVYEENDVLVCQDCRAVLPPKPQEHG